jgi:hypothetical protein
MEFCQNQLAARFAFPETAAPVADRRMTLEIQCRDVATYSSDLRGIGTGRGRVGASEKKFMLCDNHSQLFQEIDRELVGEGWARAQRDKPVQLL